VVEVGVGRMWGVWFRIWCWLSGFWLLGRSLAVFLWEVCGKVFMNCR
jgi:hypothetical protein